jgi:lysophospholipase L1-like esterase
MLIPTTIALFAASQVSAMDAQKASGLVQFTGRWHWENGIGHAQWPSTRIRIQYRGRFLRIGLSDSAPGGKHENGGENSNFLRFTVNGKEHAPLTLKPGLNTYTLVQSEKVADWNIELSKRTESFVGIVGFHNLEFDVEGKFTKPRAKPRLDFYGDSDSTGYGVETNVKEEHFSPQTENSEIAFARVAADTLGFDLNLMGASGWGIYRGYGGETELSMFRVHRRALIDRAETETKSKEQPAAIMVMLGDNDYSKGEPGPEFDKTYLALVKELRQDSPKAPIFLCIGTSMRDEDSKQPRTRVREVIRSIQKQVKNIHEVEITPYDGDKEGYGADWHTSRVGHQRIGKEMATAIRKVVKT